MEIEVLPLEKKILADFFRVHSAANDADWCYCAAWWVPTWEGWGERAASENRSARETLFHQGTYDGYLLYMDGSPAGWCQCGPRDRLVKLIHQFDLDPDPGVWAITCFLIAPPYSGQGIARRLLEPVLQDLKSRGVQRVQAFPRRGPGLSAGEVWTGPERLFQGADFSIEHDDPHQPIYGLTLTQEKCG